jgi:hypothetical protein
MSLIDPRHVCSKCDGYVGHQFRRLSSRCRCDDAIIDLDDVVGLEREHQEQDPRVND